MIDFCHIAPTKHLDLVKGRPAHLVLAHLIEEDEKYVDFYKEETGTIIMDNSAFEMYKQGKPMLSSDKLIDLANKLGNVDYIVMTDYPDEPFMKTVNAAKKLAPEFKAAGYGTFFCPQANIGDLESLIKSFVWACNNPDLVDYVGISILNIPNAYNVERGNKLQRFSARLRFMYTLQMIGVLDKFKMHKQKIHMLGMVDGPNEILFMKPFHDHISTWDSSAAIWAGLNHIRFDNSPTGLRDGKYEKEVDFDVEFVDIESIRAATTNMYYIDGLCKDA